MTVSLRYRLASERGAATHALDIRRTGDDADPTRDQSANASKPTKRRIRRWRSSSARDCGNRTKAQRDDESRNLKVALRREMDAALEPG